MPTRKPWLAAILSLLSPGVGQLYALRPGRAAFAFFLSLVAAVVVVLPTWIHAGRVGMLSALAVGLGILALIVVDAANVARRAMPQGGRPAYDHWYVYVGLWLGLLFGVRVPLQHFMRAHFVEAFHIPTGAMEPTLLVGDLVYVDRHERRFTSLGRGDIVVFTSVDEPGVKIITRLVGLPGDRLEMRHGDLLLNGHLLPERYARHGDPLRVDEPPQRVRMRRWQLAAYVGNDPEGYQPDRHTWGPLRVPPDSFFVLGDNRDYSYDSRYWGFIPAGHLYGRLGTVYFSYDATSETAFPLLMAVRWNRIGMVPR
jgi:signal peptidase I